MEMPRRRYRSGVSGASNNSDEYSRRGKFDRGRGVLLLRAMLPWSPISKISMLDVCWVAQSRTARAHCYLETENEARIALSYPCIVIPRNERILHPTSAELLNPYHAERNHQGSAIS